jgi:hypothetical protein
MKNKNARYAYIPLFLPDPIDDVFQPSKIDIHREVFMELMGIFIMALNQTNQSFIMGI